LSTLHDSARFSIAPGSVIIVRDEEWLVTGVEHTTDGRLLQCQGLSELVRDTTASFYEGLDADLRVLDPAEASVVADDSPHYRRSRLWLEATLRKTAVPLDGTALTASGDMLADRSATSRPPCARVRDSVRLPRHALRQLLTAASAGVRQDRQRICLDNAPGQRPGQFWVEPVPGIAFQVQRKVNGGNEVMLKFPWALPDHPADEGVLRHPRRQQLLAISECLAASRPHPAQLNAQLPGQQAAESLPQSRALGVAGVVHPQPLPHVLPAGRLPAGRRAARADPHIQQDQAVMLAALRGVDESRNSPEPPPVHAAGGWNHRWPGEHLIPRKHPRRVQKTRDLRRLHGGSLQADTGHCRPIRHGYRVERPELIHISIPLDQRTQGHGGHRAAFVLDLW
jgi:hypothetical protein